MTDLEIIQHASAMWKHIMAEMLRRQCDQDRKLIQEKAHEPSVWAG